jgi:hypothetical protein
LTFAEGTHHLETLDPGRRHQPALFPPGGRAAFDAAARRSVCSLFFEVEAGARLAISDLVVIAEALLLPGWNEPELALRVTRHVLECKPYRYIRASRWAPSTLSKPVGLLSCS